MDHARVTLFAGHYGSGKTNIAVNYALALRREVQRVTILDMPALPQSLYAILDDTQTSVVVDIGGDDRGAYALGRFAGGILQEHDYEMLLVFNPYRPLTRTPAAAVEILREIEQACHLPFTGLVNNANLGEETTPEHVLRMTGFAEEVSALTGLPLRFTTVKESLYDALRGRIEPLMPLRLQKKII